MKNDTGMTPRPVLFGQWRFDPGTGDLARNTEITRLEPQVAKLLHYFLTHQEILTSRDELIAAVWDRRIVSDDAINRCVSILRQLLSPDDKHAYIETVVRRGFISHFPAPAEPLGAAIAAEGLPARPSRWPGGAVALAVVALALVVLAAVGTYFGTDILSPEDSPAAVAVRQRSAIPMLAVLPLQVSGFAGDAEFFANGIHDDLLTQLAQLQSIQVISRTSVLEYRETNLGIRQIGQELGADAILEGSVQRIGDEFRINVQLIDAHTDVHLWAQRYDRQLLPESVFRVQAEIASAIAQALDLTLTAQDTEQLSVLPTKNLAAYRAYRQAMQARDTDGIYAPAHVEFLEAAVALDPAFVRAWSHLVGWLCFNNFNRRDVQDIARIEEIIEHIEALAPGSADLLMAQAFYTYYIVKDYPLAYQLVGQAQGMRPSDERVVELKSWIQRRLGDFAGKVDSVRLMHKLDPRNSAWAMQLARSLAVVHRYDEAREVIRDSGFKALGPRILESMLAVGEHRDFNRWAASLQALEHDFGMGSTSTALWNAQIAARDYAGAQQTLSNLSVDDEALRINAPNGDLAAATMPLVTYWLLGDEDQWMPLLEKIQAQAEMERKVSELEHTADLLLAFVSAARGQREETRRMVRRWRSAVERDRAELAGSRHYACRVLGMAGATAEAVECLRSGLVEPSQVVPFIEPYLPYYDPIRGESGFVALLAEIED